MSWETGIDLRAQQWWEGGPTGGDMCVHTADSLHCTAETNTAS